MFTFLYLVAAFLQDYPLISSIFLTGATLTRSTGSIGVILPFLTILRRLKHNISRCLSCFSAIFNILTIFIVFLLVSVIPIVALTIWKPYENYCLSRLDTDLLIPPWCYQEFPNIYNYIQKKYWSVGFGMIFERPWYLGAVSLFTNQLFVLILYRCLTSNFLTLGFYNKKVGVVDVFKNVNFLPHAYIFIINMVLVLFMANSEINSRVASTWPFYYFAFA